MSMRVGRGRPARRFRIPSGEDVRASVWATPAVATVTALIVAVLLNRYRPAADTRMAGLLWPGGRDSAAASLQVLAGSVVTVTSLTFSLVVVALQLASQQFSPRLLRRFARDRATQGTLAILLSTFVFSLAVLRSLHPDRPLPAAALLTAYLLGLVSVCALLAFLAHIMRSLRVDTMMVTVHAETSSTLEDSYKEYGASEPPRPPDELLARGGGEHVCSPRSGFVRTLDVDGLVAAAAARDASVRLTVRSGDQVLKGTPIATVWTADGAAAGEGLVEDVRAAVETGYERTLEQDAAFGFRQLEDIAVKALSPAINDPATAEHAIGHLGDLLVRVCERRIGPALHCDDDGVARVILLDRDLRYYLDLACGQIRRYGAGEPTVLVALLRILRDVAVSARDDEQRAEIARQCALVLAAVPSQTAPHDVEHVRTAADRVGDALAGRLAEAYGDRSGELRSV